MFWIKKKNISSNEGYLYLRETIYIRDKRTLKKKPKKLCSGDATKQRGKYSKKKDIYCGKIYSKEIKKYNTFPDFINKKLKKDYLSYKLEVSFNDLLDDFTNYLLDIHEIDPKDFQKKRVYYICGGYFCKETLDWIKRFNIRGNPENPKEVERFAIRCRDSGIFDDEIIILLYTKLIPEYQQTKIEEDFLEIEKISSKELKNFIQKSME